jgi:hypothetical protein
MALAAVAVAAPIRTERRDRFIVPSCSCFSIRCSPVMCDGLHAKKQERFQRQTGEA